MAHMGAVAYDWLWHTSTRLAMEKWLKHIYGHWDDKYLKKLDDEVDVS
jgi:hypothetical protein